MAATAEDLASLLVGVWKLKTFERKEVTSGKSVKSYGDKASGSMDK